MVDFIIAAGAIASVVLLLVTKVRAVKRRGACCGSCEKCEYCTAKVTENKKIE